MRLGEIQGRMARALFRPLDKSWGMDPRRAETPSAGEEAALYIRPNRRLSAFERLEIYNRSYWYRLLDAFAEDFPGLRAIVGRERFIQISFDYLNDCPSRSFTLRNLGSKLPRWLARHPELIAGAPRLALDMTHLEWADVVAFDGEERAAARMDEVVSQATEARFGLQPHLTLLETRYEVDDLRVAINGIPESRFAKAQAKARSLAQTRPEPRYVAVYRNDLSVYYRRLELPEYRLLRSLGRGTPLDAAIAAAAPPNTELQPQKLHEWFGTWARLGWLTTPVDVSVGRRSSAARRLQPTPSKRAELLLERHPELRGRFTFVQLAAPSRTIIPQYRELNGRVGQVAERINERFASGSYRPVVVQRAHHEPPRVFRFYRAADVCYVSSLHDGMNLVAKEFVAARDDERGVLVLSHFTGAARELTEALVVNPYDIGEAADALAAALGMPADEQQDRMRAMRAFVAEFNVYRWAGRMLVDAARLRRRGRLSGRLGGEWINGVAGIR